MCDRLDTYSCLVVKMYFIKKREKNVLDYFVILTKCKHNVLNTYYYYSVLYYEGHCV